MPNSASLVFDGVNDYAAAADHADLDVGGADFTVEFWVKTGHGSGWNTDRLVMVVKGHNDSDADIPFEIRTNFNNIQFRVRNGYSDGTVLSASTSGLSTSAWHHVACVYTHSGTTGRIVINGTSATGPTSVGHASVDNSSPVTLGAWNDGGSQANYWNGKLDEVRIWSVARSVTDINTNKDIQIDASTSGLVALWRANEGTGTTAADTAGTAQNMTLSGATWSTSDYPTLTDPGGGGFTGTGALSISKPALAASGTNTPPAITGTGALSIQKPVLAATGSETFSGTGALTVQKPALAAAGSLVFSGTGTLTIQKPALAATGSLTFIGTATVIIGKPVLAGTGTTGDAIAGVAALVIQKPSLAASGTAQVAFTGTGALVIGVPVLSATGLLRFVATGTVLIGAPSLAGNGLLLLTVTGTGAILIGPPVISGREILEEPEHEVIVIRGAPILLIGSAVSQTPEAVLDTTMLIRAEPAVGAGTARGA